MRQAPNGVPSSALYSEMAITIKVLCSPIPGGKHLSFCILHKAVLNEVLAYLSHVREPASFFLSFKSRHSKHMDVVIPCIMLEHTLFAKQGILLLLSASFCLLDYCCFSGF